MRKLAALIVGSLLAAPVQAASDKSTVVSTAAVAALSCVIAASKDGVKKERFSKYPVWVLAADGESYHDAKLPVTVSFPKHADGVARDCQVNARLESSSDRPRMIKIITALLNSAPVEGSDGLVWSWKSATGPHRLQMFTDSNSDRPELRLVATGL